MKIFRDEIWGRMRLVFQADHKFYKKHKFYDFLQEDIKSKIINVIMIPITKIPAVKRRFSKVMNTMASKQFNRIIDGG